MASIALVYKETAPYIGAVSLSGGFMIQYSEKIRYTGKFEWAVKYFYIHL